MLEKLLGSPKKAGSPRKPGGSPTKSPEKGRNPRFPKSQDDKVSTKGKANVHPLTLSNDIQYKMNIGILSVLWSILSLSNKHIDNNFYYPIVDPKLGPQRKTAGVRNLPKIDRQVAGKGSKQKQQGKAAKAFGGKVDFEANGTVTIYKYLLWL